MPPPSPTNRRRRGERYEALAAVWLARQGYRLLARQFRTRAGEIDLIATDADTLCFVEVRSKTTGAFGSAGASVTLRKQQRLLTVAVGYLQRHPQARRLPLRFDVVTVDAAADADHPRLALIRNAFNADACHWW